jgi:hypothetical protein
MAATVALVAIAASVVGVVSAMAGSPSHNARSEHWGMIDRNTIGSPVAALRTGPFGSFGVTDAPPFGKGSLGIETAAVPAHVEKVDFGNEVDFFGDNVLALNRLGFHVFQTGENVSAGGPRNMPNIKMEIDPNLNTNPTNFSTMVWLPPASPATNRWSGFIDATNPGEWFLTGSAGVTTACNQATTCTFATLKMRLDDGPPSDVPRIYSVSVGKGRDNQWAGAVDGLRINSRVFDFEPDRVRQSGGDDD